MESGETHEAWEKALARIREVAPIVEAWVHVTIQRNGLTAFPIGYLWLEPDLETVSAHFGREPSETDKPDYLKGIDLEIHRTRLPGIVHRFVRLSPRPKLLTKKNRMRARSCTVESVHYERLKRNPKAKELQWFKNKYENKLGGN